MVEQKRKSWTTFSLLMFLAAAAGTSVWILRQAFAVPEVPSEKADSDIIDCSKIAEEAGVEEHLA